MFKSFVSFLLHAGPILVASCLPSAAYAEWYCPYWPDMQNCTEVNPPQLWAHCTALVSESTAYGIPPGALLELNAESIQANCGDGTTCERLTLSLQPTGGAPGTLWEPASASGLVGRTATRSAGAGSVSNAPDGEQKNIAMSFNWSTGQFTAQYTFSPGPRVEQLSAHCLPPAKALALALPADSDSSCQADPALLAQVSALYGTQTKCPDVITAYIEVRCTPIDKERFLAVASCEWDALGNGDWEPQNTRTYEVNRSTGKIALRGLSVPLKRSGS